MKTLLTTTALVLGASYGALAQTPDALTTQPPAITAAASASGNVPAFRSSTFTGMRLFALDPEVVGALPSAEADWDARWTSGAAFVAGREQWESVGSISDIVLTQDGALQGVLIDIGGFLGLGARTVMVDMDQLWFVTEYDDPARIGDFSVVANLSRAQLETLPEWSDETLRVGFDTGAAAAAAATAAVGMGAQTPPDAASAETPAEESFAGTPTDAAPAEESFAQDEPLQDEPFGEAPMAETEAAPLTEEAPAEVAAAPTADELLGAEVFDAAGESVGSVSDLVTNGEAEIAEAVIDVGGFLGVGSHVVAVPMEDLNILRDEEGAPRVEILLTRDELEALPPHS